MKSLKKGLNILILLLLWSNLAVAESGSSSRLEHRLGLYGTILGDPFPCLVGANLGFNVFDFLRLTGGYGTVSGSVTSTSSPGATTNFTVTTIGGGGKFMVPGWNFTPVAGFNYSQLIFATSGPPSTNTIDGFNGSTSTTYYTAGFDWQAHTGFDLAFGYNGSLTPGVGGLPYAQMGWFF